MAIRHLGLPKFLFNIRRLTCESQDIKFFHMVAESSGVWEPVANKIVLHISRAAVARAGVDATLPSRRSLQELYDPHSPRTCSAAPSNGTSGRSVIAMTSSGSFFALAFSAAYPSKGVKLLADIRDIMFFIFAP